MTVTASAIVRVYPRAAAERVAAKAAPPSAPLALHRHGARRRHVLFSVDWPYESNVAAVDFLKHEPLEQHEKIAHLNAERVLRL